jgi:F-type H+-transporting ATPase subunit epsilon
MIDLEIYIPKKIFLEKKVDKLRAEAADGHFALMPRHRDFTAIIEPGILTYSVGGEESYIAVNSGVIVKKGYDVYLSTQDAVAGKDIETLHETVRSEFEVTDEKEKNAETALARLEADFSRRFLELNK